MDSMRIRSVMYAWHVWDALRASDLANALQPDAAEGTMGTSAQLAQFSSHRGFNVKVPAHEDDLVFFGECTAGTLSRSCEVDKN